MKLFDIPSSTYKDILTYNPDHTTIFLRDILYNTETEYWIATESGIFIYHTDTGIFIARKRKLDYNIVIPPADIYAFADGEALRKIFSNLVSNAVKYADKKVTVRLCPLEKNSGTFTIELENDGHILSPDQEEIIFKPFQRLKETHNQKGPGIGLTLASSLAELQTGKLYMKFNKKAVNTFVLTLPLKHEHESGVSVTVS